MYDNHYYENITTEEFEEAMEGFVEWHREIAETEGVPFENGDPFAF